jgi:hypothetical protein
MSVTRDQLTSTQTAHPQSIDFRHLIRLLNPRSSLRARIGISVCITALALAVGLSLVLGMLTERELKRRIGLELSELAYQMTDKLDRGMFERYRDVRVLATLDLFRDPSSPVWAKRDLLDTLQDTFPDYAWIGLTDTRGSVVVANDALLEGVDVSARPWYQGALDGPFVGDVHKALLLESLIGNPDDEPLRFVDVATPVYDVQDQFIGVLGAHLSWSWAREVEASLLEPLHGNVVIEMLVVSPEGQVLLAPPNFATPEEPLDLESIHRALTGDAGSHVETWADGDYLTGYAQSQGYRDYPGLVLQLHMMAGPSVVGTPCSCLMPSPPERPGQNRLRRRWMSP